MEPVDTRGRVIKIISRGSEVSVKSLWQLNSQVLQKKAYLR